jgi:hypothetical protein
MDYPSLLKAKRQELDTRIAEIDALKDEVETLEKAAAIAKKYGVELSNKDAPVPMKAPAKPKKERSKGRRRPSKLSLADGIQTAVTFLTPPYTTSKVKPFLDKALYENEKSIPSTMRRLANEGKLSLLKAGGPGKEAQYGPPYAVVDPLRFRTEEKEGGEADDTES